MFENNSGNILKSLRKEQKLTQKKLSELTGISQSALVKYENGTRGISKNVDIALSKALNVDSLLKNEVENLSYMINRIIEYRDLNNLSNKNLANKIGISEALLSYILNGRRKLSKEIQRKIALFLLNDGNESLIDTKLGGASLNFPSIDKNLMGNRIKTIRKNRGESLEKFGQNFTCPARKNVINRWENGVNIPDVERLMNVAYLGGTTVPALLYGEGYKNMLKEGKKIRKFEKLAPSMLGVRFRKIRSDYRLERINFGKLFSPSITKWSIDKYENGKDVPNTERIIQYAYIGKVSLEFLIYGN
ncbi:helix-turn-helix domain-containing protein [Enterococcus faecalis]|nr:helix-turn-helix domain-containing protein [Enterococcus faecalis]EGO5029834.1 helix-turn-helix domain-containing protein [Enterococcus faecalis]EGO5085424.1 helix-turn-helix domain-containing protein [Enterococcus faecalis]EGO5093256.1 helix-turn-helix domain-containing protein [Enterococcus faecalis]EGO5157547.1 helix-turn-helix domain-containing protein [Enterococcus faecalis]EGO6550677.1 helix-turn-helix domain-containing protein [Enterococcus faecalis]